MTEPLTSENVYTKLRRVATLAQEDPGRAFRSLAHHIDMDFLREAYRRTRKSGAPGVDGLTAADYRVDLEGNLRSLLDRFKSGSYRAPPVRRVHIPKGDGKTTRPIGIPTFEDKVLQRAVTMLLEAVYEQDFYECSYGFRPRRSAHQALERIREDLMEMRGAAVLEVDVSAFFDSLSHQHLRAFLDRRVHDGVIRRQVDKWLKAGVLDKGQLQRSDAGSPQGGVVSPLLANIFLHEVLDRWFHDDVRPRMRGRVELVRYADDFVLLFELESDARRVEEVLPKRLQKYDLTAHPEKTRLIPFHRPPLRAKRGSGTFVLLGFTHYWGRSMRGFWVIKRKTAPGRLTRAIRAVHEWCRVNRHKSLREQHETLLQKLRGHCGYYGITGNSRSVARFQRAMVLSWWKWLGRRSRLKDLTWEKFERKVLSRFPLPVRRRTLAASSRSKTVT